MIFDITGVHKLSVNYCACGHSLGGIPRRNQLIRAGWIPATLSRPKTAFSFRFLDLFHKLTTQSKLTLYDYYKGMLHFSDNAELGEDVVSSQARIAVPNVTDIGQYRYNEITIASRIYNNLKMLKRGGRGHDTSGIAGTKEGSLAVECPPCPHPGRNLPAGWKDAPENIR